MPDYMYHFDSGFYGIVEGTYSQKYGGTDIKSYSIFKIENNKVADCISWYPEELLSLAPVQDYERAEEMIEEYRFSK